MTKSSHKNGVQGNLFKPLLRDIVSTQYAMVKLADAIDWQSFEDGLAECFSADNGRPSCPVRLMVGLHYLKYASGMSDEGVLDHGASTGYSSRQSRQESPGTGRPGMRSRRGSKSRVRIISFSSSTARAHSGTVACSMRSNCSGREAKVSPRSKLVTLRSSGMESLQKAAFCIRLLKNALFVAKKAVGRRDHYESCRRYAQKSQTLDIAKLRKNLYSTSYLFPAQYQHVFMGAEMLTA